MSWDIHDLSETLCEVSYDEFSDLTCVKMALRVVNKATDREAFEDVISYLRIDMDKMRDAKTTAGKRLYAIVHDSVFGSE